MHIRTVHMMCNLDLRESRLYLLDKYYGYYELLLLFNRPPGSRRQRFHPDFPGGCVWARGAGSPSTCQVSPPALLATLSD